jgi:hypothetical protein
MPEPVFTITNVAMHPQTKVRRFFQPGRVRQKQFIGPHRLLHNETLRFSPQEFEKHADSILERVKMGAFQVTTPDGQLIFADPYGVLKIRMGQEIRDLDYKPQPKTEQAQDNPPVDEVEAQIKEMVADPTPVTKVEPLPVMGEPDLSAAYQAQVTEPESEAEKKHESSFGGKKGKRR